MKNKFFTVYITLVSSIILLFIVSCSTKHQETNIKNLQLNKTEIFLQVASFETLQANIEDVKWRSGDSGVAKVEKGKVTAVAVGKTVIRAIKDEQIVLCTVRVGDINIEKNEYSVQENKTVKVVAQVRLPQDDGDNTVTWKSEDASVATVDPEGTVTGMKVGKTRVIATNKGMKTTCNIEVIERELAFDVNITNIQSINASYFLVPNKNNVMYAFGIMTKAKYEKEKNLGDAQNSPLGIFAFDKAIYKNMADTSNGRWKSWQEAAKANNFYKTGKQTGKITDAGFIDPKDARPGIECILYYYLIGESDDVPKSRVFIKEFRLAPKLPSYNKVTCEIKQRYLEGVRVNFTTTNTDSYFVEICEESHIKWYTEGSGKVQGKTLEDLAYNLVANSKNTHIFSGNKTITPKEIKTEKSIAGTTYYLVWFVYDAEHGVRSDVWLKNFTSTDEKWTE